MHDHWTEFGYPPHIQLALFFGQGKRSKVASVSNEGTGDLSADFGGGGVF